MGYFALYLAGGLIAGFVAGLFGVGGGLIIVPILTFIFVAQNFPIEHIVHLALGTSLASIIFTSVSSIRAHDRHGAVHWHAVKRIAPGIVLGTLGGTVLAARLATPVLTIVFVLFVFYVATQILLGFRPKPSRGLPGNIGMTLTGSVIGAVSSLVGIGGGTLSVPFLTWCNLALPRAIGTSAAIGLPIAVAGAVGYIINGLSERNLPQYAIGFIYLPALAGVILGSVVTAPLGAKLTHSLPVDRLRKLFALLLYVIGARMAWQLL